MNPWRAALPALMIGPLTYLITVLVFYVAGRFR